MAKIIGITGVSGAGKTTLSRALSKKFGSATVVHWDDFDDLTQSPADYVEWYKRGGTHDEWKAEDLAQTLSILKQGRPLICPATRKELRATDLIIFDTGLGYGHRQTGQYIDFLVYLAAHQQKESADLVVDGMKSLDETVHETVAKLSIRGFLSADSRTASENP